MIAVDTNLLVYAHRADSPWFEASRRCIAELAEGRRPWGIPWHCLHEFLCVVTHPRVYSPPTPLPVAIEQVDAWLESPHVTMLGESQGYWNHLRGALTYGRIVGPKVHDAHVAALCAHHGVKELWTADRDFSRFPALITRNPLVT